MFGEDEFDDYVFDDTPHEVSLQFRDYGLFASHPRRLPAGQHGDEERHPDLVNVPKVGHLHVDHVGTHDVGRVASGQQFAEAYRQSRQFGSQYVVWHDVGLAQDLYERHQEA